ncbi:hypothetical protein PIB30_105801, partial [Stylosanthes scabra]|nr:hypothetical protein [Stylosanthes scabra]
VTKFSKSFSLFCRRPQNSDLAKSSKGGKLCGSSSLHILVDGEGLLLIQSTIAKGEAVDFWVLQRPWGSGFRLRPLLGSALRYGVQILVRWNILGKMRLSEEYKCGVVFEWPIRHG